MSIWRDKARLLIAKLTADLPADATIQQRRKALWGKGWEAHQGTSWGRKMWGKEVRRYLAGYGDTKGRANEPAFDWPAHVHFPYRGEEGGK